MNRMEIYGGSQGQPIGLFSNNQPTHLSPSHSLFNLTTKYYQATINIHYLPIDHHPTNDNHPQAIIIIFPNHNKIQLTCILERFNHINTDCRLVILDIDPERLEEEEEEEWTSICLQHGFESHSSFDLAEASMAIQCCRWPTIRRHTPATREPSTPTLHPDPQTSHLDHQSTLPIHPSSSSSSTTQDTTQTKAIEFFDDDFSDFITADTSENWQETSGTEETEEEITAMIQDLFDGTSLSSDESIGDLDKIISTLDQLKLQASKIDHQARKRLAARVALTLESHLTHLD